MKTKKTVKTAKRVSVTKKAVKRVVRGKSPLRNNLTTRSAFLQTR